MSCPNNELAFNGRCVTTCPSNTVVNDSGNGTRACTTCHPDCETCSGPSFTQCTSCPPTRPVPSNGRCLPTCDRGQYFDSTSNSCQQCDSSCASCAGSANNQCLSCSSEQVLRGGTCVPSACSGSTGVVDGLGVCFSDLVAVPSSSTNGTPLPTISGLTQPVTTATRKVKLAWWEILLMALGCAFICLVFILLWRRRARRKRAQRTAMFARTKGMDGKWWWRTGWRARFAKLFGRGRTTDEEAVEAGDLEKMEERRWSGQSTVSKLTSVHDEDAVRRRDVHRSASVYSAMSGIRREVRQPVKEPEIGQKASRNPFAAYALTYASGLSDA